MDLVSLRELLTELSKRIDTVKEQKRATHGHNELNQAHRSLDNEHQRLLRQRLKLRSAHEVIAEMIEELSSTEN